MVEEKDVLKWLTQYQGNLEENLKVYGGKKSKDLSKEDVFAYMKYKAQWELLSELVSDINTGQVK